MKDLIHLVERFELLEERAGITFEALFVGMDDHGDLHVNLEVHPRTGTGLQKHIDIIISLHDPAGRVVALKGPSRSTIMKEGFFGFQAWSWKFYKLDDEIPAKLAKIRIYPQEWPSH